MHEISGFNKAEPFATTIGKGSDYNTILQDSSTASSSLRSPHKCQRNGVSVPSPTITLTVSLQNLVFIPTLESRNPPNEGTTIDVEKAVHMTGRFVLDLDHKDAVKYIDTCLQCEQNLEIRQGFGTVEKISRAENDTKTNTFRGIPFVFNAHGNSNNFGTSTAPTGGNVFNFGGAAPTFQVGIASPKAKRVNRRARKPGQRRTRAKRQKITAGT